MVYIPINQFIYSNGFSGALAATVLSDRAPTSDIPTDYTAQILIAQAFAQQLDTVAGAGGPPGQLPVIVSQLVAQLCAAAWQDRAPTSTDPLAYDGLCKTILAIGSNIGAVIGPIPNLQANGQVLTDNTDTTFGFLADKLAAGAGVTLVVLNPGANEQLQISAAGGGATGPNNAVAYYDGAGNNSGDPALLGNQPDAFQRPQIHDFRLGATSRGAVYRLGAWSQDGDPVNVTSEGYVTYGANAIGAGPNATDGGMGFFEPNGFGIYNVIPGVNGGNTFLLCGFEDGSVNAPFGYIGFQINDNTFNPLFHVPSVGPDTGFVFLGQTGRLHGSGSLVQMSSIVASRPQFRANQYGANTGVPGMSTFKSRGATVGSLAGCIAGDVIGGITCVGVCPDNAAIPLAGLFQCKVPAAFVPAGQNWLPTDWELQTVPIAGPINSRRIVFRASSEGETQTLRGIRAGGPNTTAANFGTTGRLWSTGVGSPEGVIVGSVGDLWTRTDGVANDTLYVKESGNVTNTGWTPVRQTLRGAVPAPFPIAAIGATQGFTVTVPGALPGMAVSASVDPTGGVGNQWILFASSVTAPNLVDLQYVCLTGAVAPVVADINVAVSQ